MYLSVKNSCLKLTPIIYKRVVISKLMTQDSLKVYRKKNIPLIHTLTFILSICSGIMFQIIEGLESRIYFRWTLIRSKMRVYCQFSNHIILKKNSSIPSFFRCTCFTRNSKVKGQFLSISLKYN
jgi:hypothetical protein